MNIFINVFEVIIRILGIFTSISVYGLKNEIIFKRLAKDV